MLAMDMVKDIRFKFYVKGEKYHKLQMHCIWTGRRYRNTLT